METVERWAAEATEALGTSLKQQRALQHKLNDLESRSRRNNIRIFGVAEGEEGEDSGPEFIEALIRSKLPVPDGMALNIQRAHRAGPQRPAPDIPPRAFIINFQEFATKEWVLKEAWKKAKTGQLQVNNKTLYFDHDYTAEVVKKHKEYNGIKKALKMKGVRFQTPFVNMRIHWETGSILQQRCGGERGAEEMRNYGGGGDPSRGRDRLGSAFGSCWDPGRK